jgi:hypothetical protein
MRQTIRSGPAQRRPHDTRDEKESDMDAQTRLTRLAQRTVDALDREGLSISFHHDMPRPAGLTEVRVEVFEGRSDDEALLVRNAHVFEPGERLQRVVRMDGPGDDDVLRIVDEWLAPAVEILREDVATRAMGFDPLDPPDTILSCSPVTRSILVASGIDLSALSTRRGCDGTATFPRGGIGMGRIAMSEPRGTGLEVELELSRRRLYARRLVTDPRLPKRIPDIRVFDGENATRITIPTPAIPLTVVGALPGRRLGDLLEHPWLLDCADLEIIACAQELMQDGAWHTTIDVSGTQVPLHMPA